MATLDAAKIVHDDIVYCDGVDHENSMLRQNVTYSIVLLLMESREIARTPGLQIHVELAILRCGRRDCYDSNQFTTEDSSCSAHYANSLGRYLAT